VSPEPWDHIFVSKHHYSIYLAKRGNRVFFLNPPTKEMVMRDTRFSDVFSVHYKGFVKGLKYLPKGLRRFFVRQVYAQLQELCKVHFDVVWSFDNSVFFDFDALPADTIKISHIVDLNQNFQTKRAASSAGYCFCTTELIRDRLREFNFRVTKINHGFHLPSEEVRVPGLLNKKRTALYAGNLGMPYIDWVLLKEIVTTYTEVDFIFVGPNETSLSDIPLANAKMAVIQSPNTHFLGEVVSDSLQNYYRASDLLLITYLEEFHKEQANPHKMMEYLGSGKMIVATFTSEYVDLFNEGLFLMSKRNAGFREVFGRALKELSYWNSEDLQAARKSFAIENTYEKQIKRIQNIIDQG